MKQRPSEKTHDFQTAFSAVESRAMALITTRDKTFMLQSGETLLEALERTGHKVEFQCRSGYCGSCRVRLLDGRVDYDELPLAFFGSDEILPCCCRVNSNITVDCRLSAEEQDLFEPDLFDVQQ